MRCGHPPMLLTHGGAAWRPTRKRDAYDDPIVPRTPPPRQRIRGRSIAAILAFGILESLLAGTAGAEVSRPPQTSTATRARATADTVPDQYIVTLRGPAAAN